MRQRLGIIALSIGVLADIVLVTLAIQHVRPAEPESVPDAASRSAGGPSRNGSSSAFTKTPTYLSISSDGSFVRATRGSCGDDEAPVVEISTDDGRDFAEVAVAEGLSEVLQVRANDATDMRLVGANLKCELGVYRTSDAGASWTRTPGTVGLWHLVPKRSRPAIHSPSGVVDAP